MNLEGDELKVRPSKSDFKEAAQAVLKLKTYRDAVEVQCKGIDESAALLVSTIDHCLTEKVLYPAVLKGQQNINRFEVTLSLKALNTCRSELSSYFEEKEKRTDLTEKEVFKHDKAALESLNFIFEQFGVDKAKKEDSVAANSELIKSLKEVSADDLCLVKLSEPSTGKPQKEEDKVAPKPKEKKKDSSETAPESFEEQSRTQFEESTDVTIEEEETFIPYAPKKIIEEKPVKPVPQPEPVYQAPKPGPVYQAPKPGPVYQAPKPTFQPVPYKPAPIPPKNNDFEPVPKRKNNPPPFIPAARPATGKVPVATGGPVPVGGGFPVARSFGLSLGFGSYSSNVTAPLIPPPMPLYPPMPMGGGMMPMGGGGLISGASSAPRGCLVCSSAPTPMPVLGLNTMLARPCLPNQNPARPGLTPAIGACRPNMNMPFLGTVGVNPYFNQIPRTPGTGIIPGTPVNPSMNQPVLQGGNVPANRNTVPRTSPSLSRTTNRRLRR